MLASPLHLTVQPKGTNQVALTMWPVNQAGICGVLVRSNRDGLTRLVKSSISEDILRLDAAYEFLQMRKVYQPASIPQSV